MTTDTTAPTKLIPLDSTLLICGVPASFQSRSASWSKKGLLERMDKCGITDIDTSFGFIVYFRCSREQLGKFSTRFKMYAQTKNQYVYIVSESGQGPRHWYK